MSKYHNFLTENEKVEIRELFKSGLYSSSGISDIVRREVSTVIRFLKREGFVPNTMSKSKRRYRLDENYFDNIDTEEKAYFLGFLFSDGYNNTTRYVVAIGLQEADKTILEQLRTSIKSERPLLFVISKNPRRAHTYRLIINSQKISKQLDYLGCVRRKSLILKFPTIIPESLIHHFVRGYFDGDGCITGKECSIISSQDFCTALSGLLNKQGIRTIITTDKRGDPRTKSVRISGVKNSAEFLKWLYDGANIYLDRKFLKYKERVQWTEKIMTKTTRICSEQGCSNKHYGLGLCRVHYRKLKKI